MKIKYCISAETLPPGGGASKFVAYQLTRHSDFFVPSVKDIVVLYPDKQSIVHARRTYPISGDVHVLLDTQVFDEAGLVKLQGAGWIKDHAP